MNFLAKIACTLTLAIIPAGASACFMTPDSRPLIGCMPYNFSAPMDWRVSDSGSDDARRPELVCYRRSARSHVALIERLYGQMQSGQPADAFSPLANAPDLNGGNPYDFGATQYIKQFTPEFVRAYYPPLYAIIRDFEGCMREVANQGCGDVAGCRINGWVVMGYLPDGNQYPVVGLPEFDAP
ncbi:hypothetical protein KO516_20795 [Citreicella sp. C3M06]|uniref:hypothetical protein n=1 Tax=Citreicella sp. C3M06 TaxID=2841564 RepID=UPI001C090282|nr:hypothetical protein [Citreicella sp. C3M06]MBU2963217.1 hypothetical protein [Citreicella sp. C3M06]